MQRGGELYWLQDVEVLSKSCHLMCQCTHVFPSIPVHRAICAGCVNALAFIHERGVAHGSIGSGAVLLSHVDDRKADQLVVKLDNFGFAQRQTLPPGTHLFGIVTHLQSASVSRRVLLTQRLQDVSVARTGSRVADKDGATNATCCTWLH